MICVRTQAWPEAMDAAIGPTVAAAADVRVACERVRDRIAAAAATLHDTRDEVVLELLDLYDGAQDLLRRWSDAVDLGQSGDPVAAARASILLHDFRPVRPYARRLGAMIEASEQRARVEGLVAQTPINR